jgi:hypothetical protein
MAEVYIHETPKARKWHKCVECGGFIDPGERYHKHFGIWDHEPTTYKVCNECEAIRSEMYAGSDPDEIVPFTFLQEYVFETDRPLIKRFIDNKRKRHANIPLWMETWTKENE